VPRCSTLFFTGLTAVFVACAGTSETTMPRTAHPNASQKKQHAPGAGLQPMTAHRFAEVTDVVGPYVGRDGDVSLAAWAEAAPSGRSLFAAAIDAKGIPAKPARIGNLAPELDLLLVRGFGTASAKAVGQPRFAVVATRRSGEKTSIDVTALSASAVAVWGPTSLVERAARVLWVGFVVAGEQPLLLWAEQPSGAKPGDAASVYGLPVATDGKVQQPVVIVNKACVWQAAAVAGRAALASVKPGANGCATGTVTLDLLGANAKSEKSIELGGRAALDLDLVASPDAFVLAWSDREQLEPRAVTAVVDVKGAVRSPAGAAVAALGEQGVIALAAGPTPSAPAFLVWENLAERPEGARFFEISLLNANGRASGAHSRLLYGRADGGAPELASYGTGLAALTLAPACSGSDDSGSDDNCAGSPVPTFVAFDGGLKVQASEPLMLDALGGHPADLGWGLTCQSGGCFALAAPSRSPAALFTVPLPLRESPYRAAAEETALQAKPRVSVSDVLLRAETPLSQISVAELNGRSLVGYVTDFDPTTPWQKLTKPAEDGRLEPLRARIALRPFAADGARSPLGDEQVLSLRAHSLGGLSLLADPAAGKDALAVWTGLDKGEPQVFLTSVGPDGKRGQQRMLTRKSGEASDVAGLLVDGGYLVAWVDERSGDAEVYATRVGKTLEKAGPEQRITTSDGAASQLTLTRVAGRPFAVWADARAAEEPGWADIYGTFLRPSDAARDGSEHRLSSTRQHSFSPQMSQLHGTPVVAWLEEGVDATPASVRLALLSPSGDLSGNVSVVPINGGVPRGLGISCQDVSCRVVVTVEADGRGELHGFEWRPSSDSHVTKLSSLGGPSAVAVPPLVLGNFVYVADLRDGQGLVRRLGIDW
jgi:hypothetical protein